jgi:hypothetical protein
MSLKKKGIRPGKLRPIKRVNPEWIIPEPVKNCPVKTRPVEFNWLKLDWLNSPVELTSANQTETFSVACFTESNMKNLMAKIKTLDYKQFALQHGEKIGLGVVGLVALVCLGMTNWASSYTGSPESMEKKADDTARNLSANRWPETAKNQFLPLVDAENELNRVVAKIEKKDFEWRVDMSPKLYQAQVPADEADWTPVSELYAFNGKMPLAVAAPQSLGDAAAEEPEAKKPVKGGKKGGKKNDADDLLKGAMGGMMPGAGGGGGGGFGAVSAEKARGVRFNVVVGIVNAQQQYKQLWKALHLDFVHQAKSHLVYSDFKIQRQRAVPGPDPWTGPWKDVSTETSIDVLMNEASDFDPEIVSLNYTNVAFTSPLPHRLDDDWDSKLVVHPKIPTLTEDDMDRQDQEMRAISEVAAGDEEASGSGRGRGFRKIQKDAGRMRESVMNREGGMKDVESIRKRNSGGGPGMPGMDSRGMAPPPPMGGGRMGPQGMGGNMAYGPGAADGGADLLLFRYFDFDVEPGECYRYRVQLVVENPSYGQDFVSSQTVAEGEFRETPWSSPSTAIAVEKDVDYALVKVPVRGGVPTGADLNVVQYDPNAGTLLNDTLFVKYGAYVGADKKKTLHLELAPPDLKEEEVTFSSKDILLDSERAPQLSAAAGADLKLSDKQKRELTRNGDLDLAVTLNRFGEIVDLDAGSKQDLKSALEKVKDEREPYKDIDTDNKKRKKEVKDAEKDGKKGKRGRRGRGRGGKNPLKSNAGPMMGGSGGAGGFGPGSSMPGAGPPGGPKAGRVTKD